jgi:hypothetical protein
MICRLLLTSSLLLTTLGCGTNLFQRRTVYVEPGVPMRTREPIEDVKCWVFVDGKWEPSEAETIPEGAYIVFKRPKTEEAE